MTWTDKVLAGLAELQAGRGDPKALLTTVRTTAAGVARQLESFRANWSDDPEISEAEAGTAEAALQALVKTLEELASDLASGQSAEWTGWTLRIERPLAALRAIRDKSQKGPTSHPLVNRLLLHLAPWQAGRGAGEATRILLDLLPELEEQWDRVISQIDEAGQGELARSLVPALEVFDAWRAHLEGPPPAAAAGWHEQVVQALECFDDLLGQQVQADLAAGPTAFPLINLLVTAMEKGADQVRGLAGHAITLLRGQQNPEVLKQSRLLEVLAQIQAGQTGLRDGLVERAEQLAMLASMYSGPETLIDLTSQEESRAGSPSLPPMLASLHQLAADRLAGKEVALQTATDQLEQIVARFRSRPGAKPEEGMQLALEDLATAAELLRELAAAPTRELFEEFEEVLEDCAESLGAIQTRNRASTS